MEEMVEFVRSLTGGGLLGTLIAAALILVATAIIAGIVTKFVRKVTHADLSPFPASTILVNICRAVVWIIGIAIMLSTCFGVDVNGLFAALGVGGIAVSLGLQDTIKNLIGGLQVTVLGIVRPGDHIQVGSVDGIVKDVSWRQTVVEDYENTTHLIPNAVINSTTVQKIEPALLVATPVCFNNDGRGYETLIREAEVAAKRAVEGVAELEKDPWILLTQVGEYGAWGKMRFVLQEPTYAREARDAALRAIAPYTRNDAADMLQNAEIAE